MRTDRKGKGQACAVMLPMQGAAFRVVRKDGAERRPPSAGAEQPLGWQYAGTVAFLLAQGSKAAPRTARGGLEEGLLRLSRLRGLNVAERAFAAGA